MIHLSASIVKRQAHLVSHRAATVNSMIVTYRYRLLPAKCQHRALERILESQRQLYNAALEERIGAYSKAGVTRTHQELHFQA